MVNRNLLYTEYASRRRETNLKLPRSLRPSMATTDDGWAAPRPESPRIVRARGSPIFVPCDSFTSIVHVRVCSYAQIRRF